MNKRILKKYEKSLLTGENKEFVYTYGERLYNWNIYEWIDDIPEKIKKHWQGYNQIESIIGRIKKSRNTRRATATTWIPDQDGRNNDVPCLVSVDFKLRISKLYLTAYFRSNDFYGAFPYNIVALSCLQDYVADELEVDTAGFTLVSSSSHIGNYDKDSVLKILKKRGY